MSTALRAKDDHVKVKQFVTDKRGHKVGAILDMKELNRIEELIEDLWDLKIIKERVSEPTEDYEAYSRKRKTRSRV